MSLLFLAVIAAVTMLMKKKWADQEEKNGREDMISAPPAAVRNSLIAEVASKYDQTDAREPSRSLDHPRA